MIQLSKPTSTNRSVQVLRFLPDLTCCMWCVHCTVCTVQLVHGAGELNYHKLYVSFMELNPLPVVYVYYIQKMLHKVTTPIKRPLAWVLVSNFYANSVKQVIKRSINRQFELCSLVSSDFFRFGNENLIQKSSL